MKRLAAIFLLAFASALGVMGTSTHGALAGAGPPVEEIRPCPGPYYATPPPGTAIRLLVRRGHVPKITKGSCEPPPAGAYNAPRICNIQFTGYGTPNSLMTCAHIPLPICGTAPANRVIITGIGLHLTVPGKQIYQVAANGSLVPVNAIIHHGGEYVFVPNGQSPLYVKGEGQCSLIPLPITGGAPAATAAASTIPLPAPIAGLLAGITAGALGLLACAAFLRRRRAPAAVAVRLSDTDRPA